MGTQLFYDERDDRICEERGDRRLYWLDDLGGLPFSAANTADEGFLFAGARSLDDYRRITAELPGIRDRSRERGPLLRLDAVLGQLEARGVEVATPRTWSLALDVPLPDDLTFPLFLRTGLSSWKLGGTISRVSDRQELTDEAAALRRGLGWDATILAREWLELAPAGESIYGPVPQEIRVWVVDGEPFAWSFHHLHVVPEPAGFPPSAEDLSAVRGLAQQVASAFESRLVAVDCVRLREGGWVFLEAGPGSCAGTGHEAVFKAVAGRLSGLEVALAGDALGGFFA